tara:strand:- start:223 stop:414 length:192 start_codon:yes stop_codon:yes gene_type:complete
LKIWEELKKRSLLTFYKTIMKKIMKKVNPFLKKISKNKRRVSSIKNSRILADFFNGLVIEVEE